jgi:hypothetical protein
MRLGIHCVLKARSTENHNIPRSRALTQTGRLTLSRDEESGNWKRPNDLLGIYRKVSEPEIGITIHVHQPFFLRPSQPCDPQNSTGSARRSG